jgi:aminopeptidase N
VIEVDARCEAGQRHITLRQEQFRLGSDELPGERLWSVPVQIGSVGAKVGDSGYVLLQTRTATLMQPSCDGPLLVDPGNVGFYRVRYAPPLFDALAAQWPNLSDAARFKLLADTSALVRADRASLASYFALLQRLGAEPRLALWHQVLDELKRFDLLSLNEPSRATLHRFAVRLIAPRFAQLGWDEKVGDSVEDRQLRGELAQALSYYGDATVIDTGRTRFARFVADPSSLPASLTDAMVHIAGRHARPGDLPYAQGSGRARTHERRRVPLLPRDLRRAGAGAGGAGAATARASEVPQIMRNETVGNVARSGHVELRGPMHASMPTRCSQT